MKRHERSLRDRWVYRGFGFPVTLRRVPKIRVRGAWTPDLDLDRLQNAVLLALAVKGGPLTGAELRFIRHSFGLTLQVLASRLGVTHPAVHKWEKTDDAPTGMAWTTEKDIRLLVASRLKPEPEGFVRIYRRLESRPTDKPAHIHIQAAPMRSRRLKRGEVPAGLRAVAIDRSDRRVSRTSAD